MISVFDKRVYIPLNSSSLTSEINYTSSHVFIRQSTGNFGSNTDLSFGRMGMYRKRVARVTG